MNDSGGRATRSKPENGSSRVCRACGEVCECAFGRLRASRGRPHQLPSPEVSPAKKQRKGVKVVPNRKRCKAIESSPEDHDGPSADNNMPPVVDLRSEARIAAEENSRLSKGKQIHPFFASRISAKKTTEISEKSKIEENIPLSFHKKNLTFCPPIHVHDMETPRVELNWGNWKFKESSSLEKSSISLLESSLLLKVKPLTLTTNGLSIPTKSILPDLNSVCALENGNEDIFCNNSYQADSSLWTDKFQPENSSQVCGNTESVNFLAEWLNGWHDKGRKITKKPNFCEQISFEESENSSYNDSEIDEIDIQNVLLITGPVGSGKSAAIYACAKEQGFNIVEVSASDLRNGAHIKQKFGEATESHGLGKWSREEQTGLSTSNNIENNNNETNNKVIVNKTLVLFEDVDTVFEQDRGFIATVLQLAKSTKWPIVLTSNNKKPVLPKALNHLNLEFNRPSCDELLSYLNKICTLEKTGIPIPLIKHAINSCFCDIRKSIILLQFWCQGHRKHSTSMKENNIIPFEIEAIHSILPKALNFSFPCELSEKIHAEITQTISSIENHLFQIELQRISYLSPIKSKKKKPRLKKNQTILESPVPVPVPSPSCELNDFIYTPNTPVPVSKQKSGKKRALVFSDSEDESLLIENKISLSMDSTQLQLGLLNDNANDPFGSPSHVCDTFISVVPESLCDTVSMNGNFDANVFDRNNTVSMNNGNFDANVFDTNNTISMNNGNFDANVFDRNNTISMNNGNFDANVFDRNNIIAMNNGDFNESLIGRNNMNLNIAMDECSSAEWNFNNNYTHNSNYNIHNNINNNSNINGGLISLNEIGSVKQTWDRMKDSCNDSNNCMKINCKEGFEILKNTSRISDLISETDILFSDRHPLIYDELEQSLNDEPNEMGSVYAHHGLGLYLGSNNGNFKNTLDDMAREILVSSMSSTAIGRLLSNGGVNNENFNYEGLSVNNPSSSLSTVQRERESNLYGAVLSLTPPKISLSLKGPSLHEYISSVSKISKLELSRLSETETRFFNRRSRGRHYLSSGTLQLSQDEAELLARSNSFNQN